MVVEPSTVPLTRWAANFHLLRACNLRCRFCFATFRDVPGRLKPDAVCRVIDALADARCGKLTFVGGEPTLHPHLGGFLRHAKRCGLTTCIVTNGFRLAALLDSHADAVDWVGLSVDTGDEAIQAALGRGDGMHVARSLELAARCRRDGIRLKLNTVVTALNLDHRLHDLVREMHPDRWKVFQVLPMEGQNTGRVEELLIEDRQFRGFLDRHRDLAAEGLAPVAEDNEAMRGSYVMVDPLGRCFGNATGRHVYSRPILDVGLPAALAEVGFEPAKFIARGGVYSW